MDVNISGRLKMLERSNRILQRLVILLFGAMILIVCAAAFHADRKILMRVNQLILEDEQQATRGILASTNGITRMTLFGDDGFARFRAEVNESNRPHVTLQSSKNSPLASIAETDSGIEFNLCDTDGNVRFEVKEIADGNLSVSVVGPGRKGEIKLQVERKAARILLFDDTGLERLQIMCLEQMIGFGTKDQSGKQRLIISDVLNSGPQIIIRNDEGKKIFFEPGVSR